MKQDKQALYAELNKLLDRGLELANEIVSQAKAQSTKKAA